MAIPANGSAGQNSTRFARFPVVVRYRPIGSEGEELIRNPISPQTANALMPTPIAIRPAPRVWRSLTDRPVIVMAGRCLRVWQRFAVRGILFLRGGYRSRCAARSRDQMALTHNHLVDHTLRPVFGGELPLLDAALDKDVFALLECQRDS